jgi:photosystem II stability/assembly factor-like uncharacterized protein
LINPVKYLLLLFCLFIYIHTAHSQWVQQNSGTSNVLTGISFADINTGNAVGLTHTIIRTTNGGANWVSQPNSTGANLWAVQLVNANTGITAGESGTVFKTTNGGANWINTFPPVENFWGLYMLNANTAYVCGSSGLIIKTTDGGADLAALNTGVSITFFGLNFPSANIGFCAGQGGTILKTTDGGANWLPVSTGIIDPLFAVNAVDINTVYACGENGKIIKSVNGGASWSIQTSGTTQRLVSISLPDANTGSIAGLNNTILRTTNAGSNWIAQNSGVSGQDFYGIIFPNTATGYCAGSSGYILKTTSGGFPFPVTPNLTAPPNGATGISLTPLLQWDSSAATKTYSLQLAADSSFTSPVIDTANLVFSFLNVPSGRLSNNTLYYWHVRGVNAAGNGSWSGIFRFTTIVSLPNAPGLLLPVNGASNVSITPGFSWDSTSPALFYRLQVSTDSLFASSEVDVTGITMANYNLISPHLVNNTRYFWRVQTTNQAGQSPWSVRFTFTTAITIPPPPILVSPPDNSANVSLTPVLLWRDDISVKTYQLQLSADSTFASVLIDTTGFSTAHVLVRNGLLTSITRYHWRVRTTNSLGTGPWSGIWNFNTLLSVPAAPVLSAPPNGAIDISTIVTVSWLSVPFADNYRVQVSADSTFSTTLVNIGNLTLTHYTIQGGTLQNNTVYYWKVNATNSAGTGIYSAVWHFTTVISAPIAAPVLLTPPNGAILNTTSPNTHWTDVFGATGYKINIAVDSLFISPVIDTNITPSQFTVPPGRLNGSTVYYWRVRGFNTGGYGPWSTIWNFTTGVIGINLISSVIPKDYMLYNNYPNPFNPATKIRFDIPARSHVVIKVFDILGRQISEIANMELSPGTYETLWRSENAASGIYFCRIEAGKFISVKKMLMIK